MNYLIFLPLLEMYTEKYEALLSCVIAELFRIAYHNFNNIVSRTIHVVEICIVH